jgi:hypothetical protein
MKYEVIFFVLRGVFRERDSSGTTEGAARAEGDGADSPTQAHRRAPLVRMVREAARPTKTSLRSFLIKN